MLTADFGFRDEFDPRSRKFDPGLGGGALLDVGVYCISLASSLFGRPSEVAGAGHLGQTGVDEQSAAILVHDGGRLSVLCFATRTGTPQEATVMGTEGYVKIHSNWWRPRAMTLHRPGEREELVEVPITGNGFNYEAAEVMRCLDEGMTESDVMPLDETLSVMRTMDGIRAAWGLRYPSEETLA